MPTTLLRQLGNLLLKVPSPPDVSPMGFRMTIVVIDAGRQTAVVDDRILVSMGSWPADIKS